MSENNNNNIFSGTEIAELCDSIKDIQRILKAVGSFINELDMAKSTNGNALLVDFKKWGIKVITTDLLEKQYRKINRLKEIYLQEQEKMEEKSK